MTQNVREIVERAERLYRDIGLASVRAWKRATGGLAVGYLPIWAPRELLAAQGVLPVGLMGGGEEIEIIRGDAFYQSYICHLPRSIVELGLGGQLDVLDGVLFPAICDVIRNLSGVWQMRFPDKLVRYLDVPQNFDPGIGGVFFRQELESLATDLEARGARPYDPDALRAALAAYNANRRKLRALHVLREREPWKVPTWELYLVQRAGMVLPLAEFDRLIDDYRAAVESDEARRPMDQARVLVVGSFCEQPPLGLIKTIERSGCYIVDDDFALVHRFFRSDVPLDGDPLDNLVRAFLDDAVENPTRFCGDDRKSEAMVERARACRAEGVVFCAPSFCDPALLDQPMAVAAVESIGVPWTAFKYAENTGQFQVIREQAGTFADSIKLWSTP
ncbi:MAG TPA: benzoyl-CoA reductase subunit C [Thermoanaerobaculia bacterium]